eukprot:10180154-Alexandrium_andersonii.AAC.1
MPCASPCPSSVRPAIPLSTPLFRWRAWVRPRPPGGRHEHAQDADAVNLRDIDRALRRAACHPSASRGEEN